MRKITFFLIAFFLGVFWSILVNNLFGVREPHREVAHEMAQ
jgi:hypothetical protein